MLITTAGHVDHGKSALVRALTGTETDRLPEEKARGMSINLGFAYHEIGDARVGFVDVPGHERFVRTMVAGAMSTDAVILVVAADDGVMPQTREHLAILDLLGMDRGVAVITKSDIVEAPQLAAVERDVAALLASTSLRDAPVLAVSAQRGTGMEALRETLAEMAAATAPRIAQGGFRLAVDRAFTLPGAGTVVTGTVYSGEIGAGAEINLLPAGKRLRLRGLRVHDEDADVARAGDRAALNLANIPAEAVRRGDWIVGPQDLALSDRIEVRLRTLPDLDMTLAHWMPIHIHLGAADIPGRLSIAGERDLTPGGDVYVQLALETAVPCAYGDAFIMRDQSAQRTLGGGHVVDPFGQRRGRNRPDRIAAVEAIDQAEHGAALADTARHTADGVSMTRFAATRNLTDEELGTLAASVPEVIILGGRSGTAFAPQHLEDVSASLLAGLAEWHMEHPNLLGATVEQLVGKVRPRLSVNRMGDLLAWLETRGDISRLGGAWHLPGHAAQPPASDLGLWEKFVATYEAAGWRAPRVHELAAEHDMPPQDVEAFLHRMSGFGYVVRVSHNRFFRPGTLRELGEVAERLDNGGAPRFDAAAFRDASGIGRNLTIELLEYFDRAGLTRRIGDQRELRRTAAEVFGSG